MLWQDAISEFKMYTHTKQSNERLEERYVWLCSVERRSVGERGSDCADI